MYQSLYRTSLIQNASFAPFRGILLSAHTKLRYCNRLPKFRFFSIRLP